jgi:hypothetical protein
VYFLLVNTVINARVWIHTLITINPQITLITYDHISSKAGPALINLHVKLKTIDELCIRLYAWFQQRFLWNF